MESGDEDEYVVEVQHRDCRGKIVRLVKLPERVTSRLKWWLFCRQVEHELFGTSQNTSNLLHDLEALELVGSVRHYKKAGDFDCTATQFKRIMAEFNRFKKAQP